MCWGERRGENVGEVSVGRLSTEVFVGGGGERRGGWRRVCLFCRRLRLFGGGLRRSVFVCVCGDKGSWKAKVNRSSHTNGAISDRWLPPQKTQIDVQTSFRN